MESWRVRAGGLRREGWREGWRAKEDWRGWWVGGSRGLEGWRTRGLEGLEG